MRELQKSISKKQKRLKENFVGKAGTFLALLALLCCVCVELYPYVEQYLFKEDLVTLIITNLGVDGEGKGSEIWATVEKDGIVLAPEEVLSQNLIKDSGWFEKNGYLVSTCPGEQLMLQFNSSNVSVIFLCHPYTGVVSVSWNGTETVLHNYAQTSRSVIENANGVAERRINWRSVAYVIAGILILLAVGMWIQSMSSQIWLYLYFGFVLIFIWTIWKVQAFSVTLLILMMVSVGTAIWLEKTQRKSQLLIYTKKGYGVALIILTGYTTFAIAGNQLFMLHSRMVFSINKLTSLILVAVMVYPIELAFLGMLNFIQEKLSKRDEQRNISKKYIRIISFLLIYGILTFISIGFYPANMSLDGISYWNAALGHAKLMDNTPIALILFQRLLSYIADTPYIYIQFLSISFALVLSGFFDMMYSFGIKPITVYLLSIIAAILPCNYMMITYFSSNPLFAIILLWNMLLLIRLLYSPELYARSALWIVEMSISMAALYLVRKNGFMAFAPILTCLLYFAFKYHKKISTKWIAIAAMISCLLIVTVNGFLYRAVDDKVEHNKSQPITSLLTPLASCAVNNLELPEDIVETMTSVYPLENWRMKYIPYHSDALAFANPAPEFYKITTSKALSMYLRVLVKYPDVVIKDRLDGAESLWNVFPSKGNGAYNERYYLGVFATDSYKPDKYINIEPNAKGYWYIPNIISEAAVEFSKWVAMIPLLDAVIWRSGIYIVLIFLYAIYLISKQQGKLLWVILPTVFTVAGLMLAFGCQIFAYRYFIGISVMCFIMVTICKPLENKWTRMEK